MTGEELRDYVRRKKYLDHGTNGSYQNAAGIEREYVASLAKDGKLTWADALRSNLFEVLSEEEPSMILIALRRMERTAVLWKKQLVNGDKAKAKHACT